MLGLVERRLSIKWYATLSCKKVVFLYVAIYLFMWHLFIYVATEEEVEFSGLINNQSC